MDSWQGTRFGGRVELFKLEPGGTVMRVLKRKPDKEQEGITGIETAIILIAFVIVGPGSF